MVGQVLTLPAEKGESSLGDDVSTRTYVVGGTAFIALLLGAVAVATWNMRASTLTEARRSIQQLGIALAEQTDRSFQAVDLVLQDTATRLVASASGDLAGFDRLMQQPETADLLRQRLASIPQADALSLVDASGKVVNLTRQYPPPLIDVSDRDYFNSLRQTATPRTFVSAPVRNRANNDWTVYLARRLSSPSGDFLGIALGAISLHYIEEFYQAVTTKPGSQVTLLRRDGVLLAQFPHDEGLIGQTQPGPGDWAVAVRGGGGTMRTVRNLDSPDRMVSVHVLPDRPLVLEVSLTEDAALAGWRRQAAAIAAFSLLAAGCMAAMLRKISRQFAAQQSSRRSLARRNRDLEDARGRLEAQTTELAATAEALRGNERLLAERSDVLKTTLENIDQGLLMVNDKGVVAAYNQRAIDMVGLPEALLARQATFKELLQYQVDHGEFAQTADDVLAFIESGGILPTHQVYERQRPNGRHIEVRSVPLPAGGVVRTYSDITDRKAADARIRYAAHHDELTGLANRLSLQQHLDAAIAAYDGSAGIALLYLDLDRFRLINDARGHDMGDRLLIEVARRLRSMVRETDMVARTGGDEFAVMQSKVFHAGEVEALVGRLRARMAEPFLVNGLRLTLSVSVGVAVYPGAGTDAASMRRCADIAMYQAKDGGRNTWRLYEPGMAADRQDQFLLEQALREALGSQAFQLAYQPIVSLESNAVVGYEALLRWTHPTRGEVPPQEFVAVAEATGLIVPLGRWVLETACREAASWDNQCRIAVNLSPVQFRQGDHGGVLETVRHALAQSGLAPGRLELEVTEGVLLEDTGTIRDAMLALREHGVGVTLDDFGTGHAGLSYLRRFPFEKIKIDKSFVRNLGHDRQSDAIVEAILLLCRRLELSVVAEGVEEEAQLALLRKLRCPLVQGYLIGRPMPAAQARAL